MNNLAHFDESPIQISWGSFQTADYGKCSNESSLPDSSYQMSSVNVSSWTKSYDRTTASHVNICIKQYAAWVSNKPSSGNRWILYSPDARLS